ncbi:sugar ABC transporter substrate-binding protein [Paenibacillus sp. J5C_2022]|uniref:ABC transporter substrate-binding protein n=1 Tax=Paenibacillus sp. J5C2022 TaxID=2977129 RepID=UPI0021D19F34|nr:sugar ABC transporter substrate-binding protein [Paenibacillus sp. J5C2022]MCU6708405.1 sugar ABC transporter substrate-binding protein [Paenibacillus sp. J5C2022]
MKRSAIVLLATCMMLVFALSACSNSGNGNETGSNASNNKNETASEGGDSGGKKEQVTVRFATWDSGEALKIQQDIAKKFEQQHPGIKVQVEPYSDGFDQKLAAGFGASNPPDVMYMWDFPTYYKSLEPLDSFVEQDGSLGIDDFYPGLFAYNKVDDKLYGLPAGFTTRVFYYNKKLFDDAGVDYPQDGWTWDDMAEIAKKLTDKGKKQYGLGIRADNDTYDLQGFVWSNGSSFISDDGSAIEGYMNSKETAEAIGVLGSAVKEGYGVLVGGKNQQSGDDIFKAGKIAMWESGIWPLEGFKEAGIDVGTVEPPAFPGKPVKGVLAQSAVSIAKDSKHKQEAWEFVKFYVSEEAIKMRTADLPIRISVVEEKGLKDDALYKPFYTMLERSSNGPAFLLHPNWGQINRNLSTAVEAIMLGQDPQEMLDKAVKDSAKFLQ